jgi:hypothetical protein
MAGTHGDRHTSDMGGAFMGLVIGAVALFAVLFTIVKLTNAHYAKEHAAPPAAQAPR